MVFTSGERRLLALLVLFLAAGYVVSGLRTAGLLDPLLRSGGFEESGQIAPLADAEGGSAEARAGGGVADTAGGAAGGDAWQNRGAGAPAGAEGERTDGAGQVPEIALARIPAESLFVDGFLDLNRADSSALVALPGIGPALAGRILAERARAGGFRRVDELDRVRGIGPQKLAQLRELVTVSRGRARP